MGRKLRKLVLGGALAAAPAVGTGGAAVGTAALTTGCGGLAALACIPCVAYIIGGLAVLTLIFIDHGGHGHKHPNTPPPPTNEVINNFCVEITGDSECPIDGVSVDDPSDANAPQDEQGFNLGTWTFGGPQALPSTDAHAPAGERLALDDNRKIWPDRPEFAQFRGEFGNDSNCMQVFFADSEGNGDHWMTDIGPVHIVVNFSGPAPDPLHPKVLDISQWLHDHPGFMTAHPQILFVGDDPVVTPGMRFIVKWTPVGGAELINIIP